MVPSRSNLQVGIRRDAQVNRRKQTKKHGLLYQTECDIKARQEKLKKGKTTHEFGQGQIKDRQFQ